MSEYFPGPWKVGYRAMDVLAPSKRGGDCKVCDIRGWGYLTGKGGGALGLSEDEAVEIQTANARLIAAAPEMVEALKEMDRLLTEDWGDPADKLTQVRFGHDPCAAWAKIRSALARATQTSTGE